MHNELNAAEQDQLVLHLNECEQCQHSLEQLTTENGSWAAGLRGLKDGLAGAEPALEQVLKNFKKPPQGPETQAEPKPKGLFDFLADFLAPPKEPGHLGRLGRYEILETLGRGGMGVVLKAFDESLHRVVAIKVLSPHLASNATARKRFTREAQAAAAVTHEHVVTIHAVEDAHEPPYIVMQFVSGVSLQERLDRDGPLELKEILRIGIQAARGLAAAHAQGVIHRDIKPANILLENGVERVKITDFGLARTLDDASLTQSGVVAGTPQYMSPEQADGLAVDHRTDLFSLGSVLYALCTGRPPFRASTLMGVLKRVSEDEPRPVREINPDIPDWLEGIIERLHAKNPADRFQLATEVAELLEQHLAYLQRPGSVPRPRIRKLRPRHTRSPRGRSLLWLGAAVALALSCCLFPVGFVVLYFVSFEETPNRASTVTSEPLVSTGPGAETVLVGLSFNLLSRKGDPLGRSFSRLADAVAAARDGDIIEARWRGSEPQKSGTFAIDPIEIQDKALTIRAEPGCELTFQFTSDDKTDRPMLKTNSPLVLEGLGFKREVRRQTNITVGPLEITTGRGVRLEQSNEIVRVEGASLRVANCRFDVNFGYRCIFARKCPLLVVENCQFQDHAIYAVDWDGPEGSEAWIGNSVFSTQVGLHLHCRQARKAKVSLSHCTMLSPWAIVFTLEQSPQEPPVPIQLSMEENILRGGILHFAQSDQYVSINGNMPISKALAQLPHVIQWSDRHNVYDVSSRGFLNLNDRITTLKDWLEFWNHGRGVPPESITSLQGRVRFKFGDAGPPAPWVGACCLKEGSLGQGVGKGGSDLGIDAQLVGPGPAYERWRQTPEYKKWREAIR
jgi:serine/threonine-protein kinase